MPATPAFSQSMFSTKNFRIQIDARGQVASLFDLVRQREYVATNQPAPLLAIRIRGQFEAPSSATFAQDKRTIRLGYKKGGVSATVAVVEKDNHITFELTGIEPAGAVDLVVWGPYPTTIAKTIGELIGVVRDGEYAIGIQALNVKTMGGYSDNDSDVDQSWGRAAQRTAWGSVIQAYCRDRSKPRAVTGWGGHFPNMPVPPIPGETIIGSKIALFGCAEPRVLDTLGKIEVAEGLPHPMIDGVWEKVSTERGRSYLIVNFSEVNFDELLGYTKRANLMGLYHGGPWKTWGHFELNADFPNGVKGLKVCVEKAKAQGIRIGVHTLTNFIQTNDSYVTPVPDPRLARTGSSTLAADIDATATEIPVASPEYFNNEKANWLHTVILGKELVRYRVVSAAEPWKLLDCQRGAYGTQAAAHKRGNDIGKLLDHPYNVFFPNFEMQREVVKNLARRFNETGLGQMDFDGREGCWASGQGNYACETFSKDFFDNLDHTVVNGTSTPGHFYWHINSYCNWGEPWYGGGFRASMPEYRFNNQAYFQRNYIPGMLGWYLVTETTSLSDIEWMLARAAGFNAGFALTASAQTLRKSADVGKLLDAVREWEHARRSGAFSDKQRERMRNPKTEYHLERVADGEWTLQTLRESKDFAHEEIQRQPGEPTAARWEFTNPDDTQELQFKLRVLGDRNGAVVNPTFMVDRFATFTVPVELKGGQTLLCERGTTARVYDANGRQVAAIQVKTALPKLTPGKHSIDFDCEFKSTPSPKVAVNMRTFSKAEAVKKKL